MPFENNALTFRLIRFDCFCWLKWWYSTLDGIGNSYMFPIRAAQHKCYVHARLNECFVFDSFDALNLGREHNTQFWWFFFRVFHEHVHELWNSLRCVQCAGLRCLCMVCSFKRKTLPIYRFETVKHRLAPQNVVKIHPNTNPIHSPIQCVLTSNRIYDCTEMHHPYNRRSI